MNLRERIRKERLGRRWKCKNVLREEIQKHFEIENPELKLKTKPSVILVVG